MPISKSIEKGEVNRMSEKVQVKHVIRTISATSLGTPESGAFGVDVINSYLETFLNDGWKLEATHYLDKLPEGYVMLWILVK